MSILHRGNLLWEGSRMFLPEHREQLLRQRKESNKFIPPELSPDHMIYINDLLQEAWVTHKPIQITFATQYSTDQFCGWINKIDPYSQMIHISNQHSKKTISFNKLIDVEPSDL